MAEFQIRMKSGEVNMVGHPMLMRGLYVLCKTIYDVSGQVPVITSIWDQSHETNSLHYIGCAGDVRSHYLTESQKEAVLVHARDALGSDYDLLLHPRGEPSEHFHLEYDAGKVNRERTIREAMGAA